MKGIIRGAALLSAASLATAAHAGDGGVKDYTAASASTWSGYYIGGFAGGAWGESSSSTSVGAVVPGSSYFQSDANVAAVERSGTGSLDDTAFTGGVLVGRNIQSGRWVYGAELDFGSFNLNAGGESGGVYPDFPGFPNTPYSVGTSVETDWLMTARARIGWLASDTLLIYATGGLALTDVEVTNSFSDGAPSQGVGGAGQSDTKAGWAVGGGVELALTGNWTIRGEYLHVDFGSVTSKSSVGCTPGAPFDCSTVPVAPSSFNTRADLSADIARAALTARF
ncbi:MAG: outer membrane beta-barrel protein [Hyphomicrobium sp.]|nr:outer membrane beta-barrel protein [Hyphomicrobium sp.]